MSSSGDVLKNDSDTRQQSILNFGRLPTPPPRRSASLSRDRWPCFMPGRTRSATLCLPAAFCVATQSPVRISLALAGHSTAKTDHHDHHCGYFSCLFIATTFLPCPFVFLILHATGLSRSSPFSHSCNAIRYLIPIPYRHLRSCPSYVCL